MRHKQEAQIIDWLQSVKNRKEPLQVDQALKIVDFKKFAELNIWRLKYNLSERIYITTIENIVKVKKAWDNEQLI
jgi:hypothetical protein